MLPIGVVTIPVSGPKAVSSVPSALYRSRTGTNANPLLKQTYPQAVVDCAAWIRRHEDPTFDAYQTAGSIKVRAITGTSHAYFTFAKCMNGNGYTFEWDSWRDTDAAAAKPTTPAPAAPVPTHSDPG